MNIQKIILPIVFISGLLISCNNKKTENQSISASEIINNAAIAYGSDSLNNQTIAFTFRDKNYSFFHDDEGNFIYRRFWKDSVGDINDILTNNEFERSIDNQVVNLSEKKMRAYSNSVNSVLYFALLPIKLTDPAVNAELIGETDINNKVYYKIKVTFAQEGGGQDHDDQFIYWFDKENLNMDFLAYSYATDGGGIRFREAIKMQKYHGLIFQDYINFKADPLKWKLADLDSAFKIGALEELSRIELINIRSLE